MIILLVLYMIIAISTAVFYLYYFGNDNIQNAYGALFLGITWPLLMPIAIVIFIISKDAREYLERTKL